MLQVLGKGRHAPEVSLVDPKTLLSIRHELYGSSVLVAISYPYRYNITGGNEVCNNIGLGHRRGF